MKGKKWDKWRRNKFFKINNKIPKEEMEILITEAIKEKEKITIITNPKTTTMNIHDKMF